MNQGDILFGEIVDTVILNPEGTTIETRFLTPANCIRLKELPDSYCNFLRTLPLKPIEAKVKHYDGTDKEKDNVYCSVVDMSLGNRDLQQCADAVMRLRSEFLYAQKKYDQIHFNFLSDGKPRYYLDHSKGVKDRVSFDKYLNFVFAFANTASLSDELESVKNCKDMEIGDVFIQKGNPYGHAVIVVDMCMDKTTNKKYFILAQSYMPAQDTQVLMNLNSTKISPWYELKEGVLNTPEWQFNSSDLKRFKN